MLSHTYIKEVNYIQQKQIFMLDKSLTCLSHYLLISPRIWIVFQKGHGMFWPILRGCTAQEQMKKEMQAISYRSFAWKKMAV